MENLWRTDLSACLTQIVGWPACTASKPARKSDRPRLTEDEVRRVFAHEFRTEVIEALVN